MGRVDWTPGLTINEAEKQCVLQALRFYRGNKSQTAKTLGISVRTLDTKLEQYEKERVKSQANYEQFREDEAVINERFRGLSIEARNRVLDAERAFEKQSGKPYQQPGDKPSDELGTAPDGTAPGLSGPTPDETTEENKQGDNPDAPPAGLHVEPVDNPPEEQPLPVPVRPQVQTVLSKHSSGNRHRGNGR